MIDKQINRVHALLFSEGVKKKAERVIFIIAIVAFILHLGVIGFSELSVLPRSDNGVISALNFLSAVYTPFSIILLYEIYALIYYFPKSLNLYLGKQYELIVLILIRKIFYELSTIPWNTPFEMAEVKKLLVSLVSLTAFCLLILLFYVLVDKKKTYRGEKQYIKQEESGKYLIAKKALAIGLFCLFVILLIWSVFSFRHISFTLGNTVYVFKSINETFFHVFFTALILTEVLVLLLTFSFSEQFHMIIRNSGFIISTVLLKLSFKTEGLTHALIVFVAIAFGVVILGIYRLFEQRSFKKS